MEAACWLLLYSAVFWFGTYEYTVKYLPMITDDILLVDPEVEEVRRQAFTALFTFSPRLSSTPCLLFTPLLPFTPCLAFTPRLTSIASLTLSKHLLLILIFPPLLPGTSPGQLPGANSVWCGHQWPGPLAPGTSQCQFQCSVL